MVEMRREIYLKDSNMTKCLNTFVAHCRYAAYNYLKSFRGRK